MTTISRTITAPIRKNISREELWEASDKGLIFCWEKGRELAAITPELATQCKAGELPPLHWKGGAIRTLKKPDKYGSLNYLATWQGLRGEDLQINTEQEPVSICTRTHMIFTFTADLEKLKTLN